MDDEYLSEYEPRVTGAPEKIWLVYGDIEHDDTHTNLCSSGEVTWCEDAQFQADVRYTRTDLVAERVHAAVLAERERCATRAWIHYLDVCKVHGLLPSENEHWNAALAVHNQVIDNDPMLYGHSDNV